MDVASWTSTIIIIFTAFFILQYLYRFFWPEKIYFKRHNLVSRAELRLFNILQMIAGNRFWVFTKIRVADLVDIRGLKGRQWWRSFARISQRHVDFVIADRTSLAVLLAVELDDRSHDRTDRRLKDRLVNSIFNQVEIPLLRFPANCSTTHVRQTFDQVIRERLRQSQNN
jgi:hypothetical protein